MSLSWAERKFYFAILVSPHLHEEMTTVIIQIAEIYIFFYVDVTAKFLYILVDLGSYLVFG